ncbi:hypothetical protein BDV95DRAFT_112491 [Massariosphaeria phaeospora]|uniref:C2H2-type domain-containing protein n=1 Tax=Massariosphaeria phaeospora TaxID=100035 RepID=A0A7C8IBM6_9PLEO|nr:hypothetical protein BDV95DRAFT_112491 [Massariosphaeria phaeospora]
MSPKLHPKSTTISRRLRKLTHRAAALPTTRHISVNHHSEPTDTPLWDPSSLLDTFTRSNTSHPGGLEQNPSTGLLPQSLEHPPYHSPQKSHTELVTFRAGPELESYEVRPTSRSALLPSPLPSLSDSFTAADYQLRLSEEPQHLHDPSVELQDMSTLGFMMPAQYGSLDHYGSNSAINSPNYPPMSQQPYSDAKPSTSGPYAHSYPHSPSLQSPGEPRRSGEHAVLPPYPPSSIPRSPYQQQLGPMRTSPGPMNYPPSSTESPSMLSSASHSYSYPAVHANHSGQSLSPLGSNTSSYPPPPVYPPSSYAMNDYNSVPTAMYPGSGSTPQYSSYDHSPGLVPPTSGSVPGLSPSPGAQGNNVMPRILNSRPKPQCWEHGCNGRQFSTFSNLLRHQREKSGTAAKSYCPRCGAEFTRTTARNGHLAHEKCKPRRASDASR